MKINYVIATCSKVIPNRELHDRETSLMLQKHLKFLSSIIEKNKTKYISQVTIMKPLMKGNTYPYYYENLDTSIEKIKEKNIEVCFFEIPEMKTSYSQYIYCSEKYDDFDYYIVMEDDWVPYTKSDFCFDEMLVSLLPQKDNIFLSAWVPQKLGNQPMHSAISVGIIDIPSLKKLKKINEQSKYNIDQLRFSLLLLKYNTDLKDYSNRGENFMIPFWETHLGFCWEFSLTIHDKYLLVPLQFEETERFPRNSHYRVHNTGRVLIY